MPPGWREEFDLGHKSRWLRGSTSHARLVLTRRRCPKTSLSECGIGPDAEGTLRLHLTDGETIVGLDRPAEKSGAVERRDN